MTELHSGDLAFLYVIGHPLRHQWLAYNVVHKLIFSKVDSILPDDRPLPAYNYKSSKVILLSFKFVKNNCCRLDVRKTWIYARISITDSHNHPKHKHSHFSSLYKKLQELCNWPGKYNCNNICMESTNKCWISLFNILKKNILWMNKKSWLLHRLLICRNNEGTSSKVWLFLLPD